MRAVRKDKFGSAKYVKALQDAQSVVVSRYDDIILCLRARARGYQLLAAHPGRGAGKQARFEAISEDFRPFLPAGEATVAIDQLLREKLQAVSSHDGEAALLTGEDRLFGNIVEGDHAIMAAITPPRSLEARNGDTVAIDLQVEAGRVMGVRVG